jgi:hypothetical protein
VPFLRKERKVRKVKKTKDQKIKKKGKCYNYNKESHFATNYYFKKNSITIPKSKEEAKKLKPKDKKKEKLIINAITRT